MHHRDHQPGKNHHGDRCDDNTGRTQPSGNPTHAAPAGIAVVGIMAVVVAPGRTTRLVTHKSRALPAF